MSNSIQLENNLPYIINAKKQQLDFISVRTWIEKIAYIAGQKLLDEFHSPAGPRGYGDKAMIDEEVELFLRNAITEEFPTHGICAEELSEMNRSPKNPNGYMWYIDPNDGTKSYLKMHRGASLSIALVYNQHPIFGIVYAYAAPNDRGDFISGGYDIFGPIKRNNKVITRSKFPDSLHHAVVALSQDADAKCPQVNAELCAPARFISVPSIAYRLALVAVGDADLALSLASPVHFDCFAGLALLHAVGGHIVSQRGVDIDFNSYYEGQLVLGGPPHLTQRLSKRNWSRVFYESDLVDDIYDDLTTPQLKYTWPADQKGVLARAQGVLLGQSCGDALGSLVEFQSPASIKSQYPDGVTHMHDGGTFNTRAGQATDDTELALSLARSLVKHSMYKPGVAAMKYGIWLCSHPFDLGTTTSAALRPITHFIRSSDQSLSNWNDEEWNQCATLAMESASQTSQANGALMRIAPLAVFGAHPDVSLQHVIEWARLDAQLTHPHQVCQDANAVYVFALVEGIKNQHTAQSLYDKTLKWAKNQSISTEILECLSNASHEYLPMYPNQIGWVKRALQGAFYILLHSTSLAEGIQRIVEMGGDTDTNAAIAGSLLGSVYGVEGIPQDWMRMILSNRPIKGLDEVHQPRPRPYWTCDIMRLAEQLLCAYQP